VVRRTKGVWPSEDPLQPLEAMGRQRRLRSNDGRVGLEGGGSEDGNDRRDLFEGAPHGDEPAVEKGGPDDQRGR
jgi:hypothetical protein